MSIFSILNQFLYLSKVLFLIGFLQFNGTFVNGQNKSKYCDCEPSNWMFDGALVSLQLTSNCYLQVQETNYKDLYL